MYKTKIRRLRKDRLGKVNKLEAERQRIEDSQKYSRSYKNENISNIDNEIKAIDQEYRPEIEDLISEYELETRRKYNNAEYEDLETKDVMVKLLKELRNQSKTKELVEQYKGKPNAKDDLSIDLGNEVEGNSPYAPAYIEAMKQLGIGSLAYSQYERQYEDMNLNNKQKEAREELNNIEIMKQEVKREIEGDPFQNKINKYK